MKLELPEEHPISQTIRDMVPRAAQAFLSLDLIHHNGEYTRQRFRIDAWTLEKETSMKFTLDLTNTTIEEQKLKSLTDWPLA